ncbi:hypothetical protein KO500_11670 [Cellulophaga baltica]|uniref:hypothetical protein n=1 Tax=Cellulophaga TaxID=104264 RepID=UPI001C06811B|nr:MULTISPECIES: hypothetical protein [Cellulophaga]MBU2997097.1 hypothetical protein [Cellulophaga baltica]MDO6768495.1 hypothetical protein [Cellulophaga sp. 1_MG-2023]
MKKKLTIVVVIFLSILSYSCGEKLTLEQQIIKDISKIKIIKDCNNVPEEAEIANVTFGNLNPVPGTTMYVIAVEYDYILFKETTHVENSYVYFKRGESYDFSKVVGGCND